MVVVGSWKLSHLNLYEASVKIIEVTALLINNLESLELFIQIFPEICQG